MELTEFKGETPLLVISNEASEIPRMSRWLDAALRQHQVSKAQRFKFDLCANEAVTNIIFYAFPDKGERQILLELGVGEDEISLLIEDDGVPFNPVEAPEHKKPSSLDDAPIGGLGIDLIRHYMDRCEYERSNNKNRLKLTSLKSNQAREKV
ncbi:Serine-protein kinase RsbW [Marinobacterium lacunae]|uniref:Serine-protein kinase RsbW n=1 Tax=Marinobacterium lacunae TaxID=1232683 RepID=A0A081FUG4_9GAMM|nr:ATP-binding protein [Marinobacterium lacunae]KEA62169.1 Serine-protein kinase RsbW [Marinobacterium lacunae]MBR9884174.1 ATP-binding protein [Oceanospirillales bacterium]